MNKYFKIIRSKWKKIIFSLSILIFLFIMMLLLTDNITDFDNAIYGLISKFRCNLLTYFFKFISFLCSSWFLLFSTVVIMIFSKSKKNGFYICLNILLCFLLNQTFKLIFTRARPVDINLIFEPGYSFPSGHSMVSLAFYGFFIYLIMHKRWKLKKRMFLCGLLSLLVLLIGISRIYLGVHFASDVLAGYALSMAYLIVYINIFYEKIIKKRS